MTDPEKLDPIAVALALGGVRPTTVNEGDDDEDAPKGASPEPKTPGAGEALAAAALNKTLGGDIMTRLADGTGSLCLCVGVPDATWDQPLRLASARHARPLKTFFRDVTQRRPPDIETIAMLLEHLDRGVSVLCYSQDLAAIPLPLRTCADFVGDMVPLTPDLIALAIRRRRGGRGPRNVPVDVGRGLNIQELAACIRSGEKPSRSLERICMAQASKSDASMDPSAPRLEDLTGYGAAKGWGLRLRDDLEKYRDGGLAWADIDAQAVLHGPPGTGKSLFARATARSANVPLLVSSVGAWFSTNPGDLGGIVRAASGAFEDARAAARAHGAAVLFLDEIDSFPNRAALDADRGSWWRPVVNFVLAAMDGAGTRLEGVVILGATNDIGAVDPALLRPGRFGTVFTILPPSPEDLAHAVWHHLGREGCPIALPDLARLLRPVVGATPATAAAWARAARARARAEDRKVTLEDVGAEAMSTNAMSKATRKRAAIHEAGHAVAAVVLAKGRLRSTSLVGTVGLGGLTLFAPLDQDLLTRPEMDDDLVLFLAGRAAEVVVGDGATSGAGAWGDGEDACDLARVTARLTAIHASLGLGATLRHRGSPTRPDMLFDPEFSRLVEADLRRLMDRAESLVRERADAVRAVALALLERNYLGGEEVEVIVGRTPVVPAHEGPRSEGARLHPK